MIANTVFVIATLLGPASSGIAQSVSQSEGFPSPRSSVPPIELKEKPVISVGRVNLSPATLQRVLENFMAYFSILARVSGGRFDEEYRILYYTILPFLASEQFERSILRAQRNRESIELVLFSPQRLKEAKMIEEFSERFHLPLDFEPNQEIVPSTVTISLAIPWFGIPIKIESLKSETVYVADASKGSILKRYERDSGGKR